MAAQAAAAGDPVSVYVKTMTGELIPVTFDRRSGEEGLRRALETVAPEEFPFATTTVERLPQTNQATSSANGIVGPGARAWNAHNMTQVQNEEMIAAIVRGEPVQLISCQEIRVKGRPLIAYHFLIERRILQIQGIHFRPDQTTTYRRGNVPEARIDAHIHDHPLQRLVILGDPQTSPMLFHKGEYTMEQLQMKRRFRHPFLKQSLQEVLSSTHTVNYLDIDDRIHSDEVESEHITSIQFRIPPALFDDMIHRIRECPLTPANLQMEPLPMSHGAVRNWMNRYPNRNRTNGGTRRKKRRTRKHLKTRRH